MEYLQFLGEYRMIIFGVPLIAVIVYYPRGIVGGVSDLHQKARDYYARKTGVKRAVAS